MPTIPSSVAVALIASALGAPSAAGDPVLAGLTWSQPIHAMAAGDLDGDGHIDVLVLASSGLVSGPFSPAGVYRYSGRGDGSLQLPTLVIPDTSPPGTPKALQLLDVTGDSVLDLISPLGLFPGVGDGTFAPGLELQVGRSILAQADLDADGDDDLLVSTFVGGAFNQHPALAVVDNPGDGMLMPTSTLLVVQRYERYEGTDVGDFNEDGQLDVVTAVDYGDSHWLRWYPGLGDGSFSQQIQQAAIAATYRSLKSADFDRDGHLDIVALQGDIFSSITVDVVLHRGLGDGSFEPAHVLSTGLLANHIELADVDGNGLIDLVITSRDSLSLIPGLGSGDFGEPLEFDVAGPPAGPIYDRFPRVTDLNGDGRSDILIADGPGFTALLGSASPFVDLGGGLAGSSGTPRLVGSGHPSAGSQVSVELQDGGLLPALLFVGIESAQVTFLGGVLGPEPALALIVSSGIPVTARWPDDIPVNTALFLQTWPLDPGTGFAATNTLAIVSQDG